MESGGASGISLGNLSKGTPFRHGYKVLQRASLIAYKFPCHRSSAGRLFQYTSW